MERGGEPGFELVRGWCRKTVEYGSFGGGWTSYSSSHTQQQQTTTKPADLLPSSVRFLELPLTRRDRSRQSPNITNRLSCDDQFASCGCSGGCSSILIDSLALGIPGA
jgi:hypothetical protein